MDSNLFRRTFGVGSTSASKGLCGSTIDELMAGSSRHDQPNAVRDSVGRAFIGRAFIGRAFKGLAATKERSAKLSGRIA